MCQPAFVPRRVVYLAAAGVLLIALVAVCLLSGRGGREPKHDGRPLSFWLAQRVPSSANLPWPLELSDAGGDAVRQIGTNWTTQTYDGERLPKAMRDIYDIIGERYVSKGKRQ